MCGGVQVVEIFEGKKREPVLGRAQGRLFKLLQVFSPQITLTQTSYI